MRIALESLRIDSPMTIPVGGGKHLETSTTNSVASIPQNVTQCKPYKTRGTSSSRNRLFYSMTILVRGGNFVNFLPQTLVQSLLNTLAGISQAIQAATVNKHYNIHATIEQLHMRPPTFGLLRRFCVVTRCTRITLQRMAYRLTAIMTQRSTRPFFFSRFRRLRKLLVVLEARHVHGLRFDRLSSACCGWWGCWCGWGRWGGSACCGRGLCFTGRPAFFVRPCYQKADCEDDAQCQSCRQANDNVVLGVPRVGARTLVDASAL